MGYWIRFSGNNYSFYPPSARVILNIYTHTRTHTHTYIFLLAICVVWRWWIGFYEFETKRPCKSITRGTKLFSLVHNNLDDLKHTVTRDGKRFYVIFVDDHSIFI